MRLGVQIKRDNNYNYIKINSNDYEKIEEALEQELNINTGRFGFDVREEDRIKYTLQKFFDNHSDFYDALGFDGGVEHGVTGQTFDTGGFRQFTQDCFGERYLRNIDDEDDLQLICNAIAERIREAVENYDDNLIEDEDNFVAKSTVTVDAEPSGKLTDPEMLDEAMVVADDGVHKIQVQTVEDAETLSDVKDRVEEDTKGVYETQVDAREETLKTRINNLEDQLESERKEMLVKGIKMVGSLDDWKVEGNYLKYTETVHLETARKDAQTDPRELTEEAKEKFYIDGIKVPIRKKIKKVKYDDAYHPHALGYGTCNGSFEADMGEEGLRAIVEQLKQADLHTTNHTDAERDMKDNWKEYIKTEETEDGEEEEVTEDVWEA